MAYYVMEEDPEAESQLYLGEIKLGRDERRAMLLGEMAFISLEPLTILLKQQPPKEMPDFLNLKYPLISPKLKEILDEKATVRVKYRPVFLLDDQYSYPYYYIAVAKLNCMDYPHSHYQKDEHMPSGIRITNGFSVNQTALKNDLFRVEGLPQRNIVISERLKKIFEEDRVSGAKYTETLYYRDSVNNQNY